MSDRAAALARLERALGYHFREPSLLAQALRHTSAAHELGVPSFERLEFLGDAALSHAVAEIVFHRWPELSEGELTRARSVLVREKTLAALAAELDLAAAVELGSGLSHAAVGTALLADALEAVLGAVLLDGGWRSLKGVVGRLMRPLLGRLRIESLQLEEPKSTLQELAQRDGLPLPVYRLLAVEGPAHNQTYVFEVELQGRVVAVGKGTSKRSAQQAAARQALETLGVVGAASRSSGSS